MPKAKRHNVDRLSNEKERFGVVMTRKLVAKVRKRARESNMSSSALISRLVSDGLEEVDAFARYFNDPDVRALFVELLRKPGAMRKLAKAAGEAEPPYLVQQSLFDVLDGKTTSEPQK